MHNAGHLFVGYVEAFTDNDLARLLDVNAVGAHRVNRAVLPHLRERGAGTLVYVGSFRHASSATDERVAAQYARLDPLVERTHHAHEQLFGPGRTADPQSVADEIVRILSLPMGRKPFRSVVDAAEAGVEHVMAFSDLTREAFVRRLGFAETLELRR
ncbi:SDR family NAD(P)-dependent oxidoreductase [Plantactinospora sp. WMMC1484]|uniref:SDR family NAD(P)-dependent oxidoreductase n=1 Tax=Plantactinospora sp. WMMC1484 TaxID=3404122 RepID=UPI003BF55A60